MNYKCENCGRQPLANTDTVVSPLDEGGARIICKTCAAQFGTCVMCHHNTPCAFQTDPDPTPQFRVVSRTVRQGNATFIQQQQIPNADRIKKICINRKCKCYNGDEENPLCCRFGGYATCTNYCEVEQFKFVQDFSQTKASEN